ncbi:hypothetical protein RJ640_026376 [Escallonia rubra]|uniref:SET domain-containing protein n=1 Tax=Escallonia rubra TaxID=112253 RepID=A0AA88U1R4_9ASTE|nr:hypothetical protein RJ640_026376 [Escallonia rubra]
MASSLVPQQTSHCFTSYQQASLYPPSIPISTPSSSLSLTQFSGWLKQLLTGFRHGGATSKPISISRENNTTYNRSTPIKAATLQQTNEPTTSSFPLFEPPQQPQDSPSSELEPADPDFYKIGFVRSVRAYGIEFKEGPDGFGVFASKDVEPLRRARVIMEIPLELMVTISQKLPWMFFPDIVPVGHPIFDIINSTNPETDWDLRLACLFLYALDREDNFWQLYSDFLPSVEECTSLLLATEEDLLELQNQSLTSVMRGQQRRALEFWEKNWHSAVPLKVKRLARNSERFIWAVAMAQSRSINLQIRMGALVQDANMFIPYADTLNHSFQPNCFFHWRFKDRMLEVMINAGQRIKKGEEVGPGVMTMFDESPMNGSKAAYIYRSETLLEQ